MIKALIRLRGCAGWSAPLLFAIKKSQGISRLCPYDVEAQASWPPPGYAPALECSTDCTTRVLHISILVIKAISKQYSVLGVQRYTGKPRFTLNKYPIAIHFWPYRYRSLPYVSSSQFSSKICKKKIHYWL